MAFLLVCLRPATAVEAGHGSYSVAFSGGTASAVGTASPGSLTQSGGTYTVTINSPGHVGNNGDPGNWSNPSAQCNGPLTATATWTADPAYPGSAPPSAVIIAQTSTASWSSPNIAVGTCNSGLGASHGATTAQSDMVTGYLYGGMDNPPASFTLSPACNPAVSATGTDGHPSADVRATLVYTVTISPIIVHLDGTMDVNGAQEALTGQQITASLPNGLPAPVTGYTWSFDSEVATKPAKPIKNWDGTASGDSTHPQLVPLTAADLTGTDTSGNGISVSPVNFYDEVQENVTVKCAVSLKFSDGTTATVNAQSVPVAFLKPSVSKWLIDTGYVQASTTNPGYFGLYAAPNSGFPGGEYWHDVTIDVPQPFSGGQGCIVQLITPAFELYKDGSTTTYADLNDKKQGLDNTFPYTQWDLPALGKESDRPQIGVAGVNVPQDQGFRTGTFNDAFVTWVMYKPPVVGTRGHIWVPIRSYSWSTSFTLQWVNNQWTFNAPVPSATTRATQEIQFKQTRRLMVSDSNKHPLNNRAGSYALHT